MSKKMLNEDVKNLVVEAVQAEKEKVLTAEQVVDIFESAGRPVDEKRIPSLVKLMQLQEKYMANENFSSNIEPFVPKLQPLLRRIMPSMLAFEIAGVQPITMPSADVFMIKARYGGTTTNPITLLTSKLFIISNTALTAIALGDTITSAGGAVGTVAYIDVDTNKIVVNVTSGTFVAGEKFDVGATYSAGADDITITSIYSNEMAFKQILKGYAGPYSTANGEVLGDEMRKVSVSVEKITATAVTRKLKAEFTLELMQDLQAMHGANADEELMNFLEYEIRMDLDRTIIEEYKSIATQGSDFIVAGTSSTSAGRWSMEMYAGLVQKILNEGRLLAKRNRRGTANILLCTPSVVTALEVLGKFRLVDSNGTNVSYGENQSIVYAGVLMNGMKVYVDYFSETEYAMPIYKGASSMDAGLIYSPYVPLQVLQATNPTTFQPVIGVMSRSALTRNTLFDSEVGSAYATMFAVDFTATPLAV